jgi:hypothetical protein
MQIEMAAPCRDAGGPAARPAPPWPVALALVALLLAGCGRGAQPSSGPPPPAGGGAQRISFAGPGGTTLSGGVYGRAQAQGVVLVPDGGRRADVWDALAADLAASGFFVLALDFPAEGLPGGPVAAVRAAVAQLQARGARQVVLIGEGAGGAAALAAAAGEPVVGVAALSAPAVYRGPTGDADALGAAPHIDGVVLAMAALGDGEGVAVARRIYAAAAEPKTLALVPGSARGAALVIGPDAAQARDVLRAFLREAFAERTA